MIESTEDTRSNRLHVTAETLPIPFPGTVQDLSEAELSTLIFSRLQELDVTYEDVADCILNYLHPSGPFKEKRVGLAYLNEMKFIKGHPDGVIKSRR
jgi:uncharacterized protein